ncbi:MAG: 50S ribosomal protein L23 [Candidatus Dadabacteria bacterium]|nr:50S ribosomal protein L23 [Candidatus Dadabacteria bacterium]NIQ15167.1 50S ribosomal protein L23 [Candidatus Dadabacteria bacterium]
MKDPRSIIKLPVITEKSTDIREDNWYVFSVDRKSNKKEIKDSIEKVFGVKVDKVRTLVTPGKVVKRFGRPVGRRTSVKKAYVKLKEGEIELFEGV